MREGCHLPYSSRYQQSCPTVYVVGGGSVASGFVVVVVGVVAVVVVGGLGGDSEEGGLAEGVEFGFGGLCGFRGAVGAEGRSTG